MPGWNRFGFCRPRPYPDLVKNGFVRALAQSGAKRYPKLTDVPNYL